MRYFKMPPAEARPDDKPAFLEALDKLLLAGADARRPPNNKDQLKLTNNLSYYPNTGTIYRDGDAKPLPVRGTEALIAHLREIGALRAFITP